MSETCQLINSHLETTESKFNTLKKSLEPAIKGLDSIELKLSDFEVKTKNNLNQIHIVSMEILDELNKDTRYISVTGIFNMSKCE